MLLKRLLPVAVALWLAPTLAWAQSEDVSWTRATGVTVAGGSLTKSVAAGWGNSGASSRQQLALGGWVEFTATETNSNRLCGLSKGDTDLTQTDVDFGIYLQGSAVYVLESGANKGAFGAYATGDRFRVEAGPVSVRYLKNGTAFYTSTKAPAFPLLVDSALYSANATLTNVRVGRNAWRAATGVTFSADTIAKTGAAGWTAGASSAVRLEFGDGGVEWSATETTTRRVAGLNQGDAGTTLADIDHAVLLDLDGTASVVESGVTQVALGTYATGDTFRVEVREGIVRYLRNGSLVHTSTVAPQYPLVADVALDSAGATLGNVVFVPFSWGSVVGATVQGATLTKTGASGWNAGASSSTVLESGDGFVEFTAVETDQGRAMGLSVGDGAADLADIDFAIVLTASGGVEVWESGVARGAFGSYATGDRLRVELSQNSVKYRRNGAVFYTSAQAPGWPLRADASLDTTGATLADVVMGDLVFTADAGLAVVGNGLTKTAASAWGNAGAVTVRALESGDGYLEFAATEAAGYRLLGLSKGNADLGYAEVDFGLYLSNGNLGVYENGVTRGSFGSYAAGDVLRVQVEAGVVSYRRNGAAFYTSSVTPQYPLLVDSAFYTQGASVAQLRFEVGASTGPVSAPTLSPPGGTYGAPQSVSISSATPGATVRYTLTGSDPLETDAEVPPGGLTIDRVLTLKAKAWKAGRPPSDVTMGEYTLKAATVVLAPGGGTYGTPQTVTLSSASPGVTIHYNTQGFDPSESDPVVPPAGTLPIDAVTTLKARAFREDWSASDVSSATYTLRVATPVLTPSPGTHAAPPTVTATTASPGATLRFAAAGGQPTQVSAVLPQGGVALSESTTLWVQGFRTGWLPSVVAGGTYAVSASAPAAPTIEPGGGSFASLPTVTLQSSPPGAVIRYTLDGSEPGLRSRLYTKPFSLPGPATLRARAFRPDSPASSVASASFSLSGSGLAAPVFDPPGGTFAAARVVTVSCPTAGSVVHFTTNGALPTENDATVACGGALAVDSSGVLRARAFASGQAPSPERRASYLITGQVVAGQTHSLALSTSGSVWAWGANSAGQLGDGTTDHRATPVAVPGLAGVVQVAAGTFHSLALKGDGTVVAWGDNSYGQVGDGTSGANLRRLSPTPVVGLSGVRAVAAGRYHNLALLWDGTVWSWGANTYGRLGDGSTTQRDSPVQVQGLSGVAAIAGGDRHSLAARVDGAVFVWGQDVSISSLVPVPLGALPSGVVGLATGTVHSVALKTDGAVSGRLWAWGQNAVGMIGDGTQTTRTSPVAGLTDLAEVMAASSQSHALDTRGRTWGWGSQGGDGQSWTGSSPVRLPTTASFLWVSGGSAHDLALAVDGRVWSWGTTTVALGDGQPARYEPRELAAPVLADGSWALEDTDLDGLPNWMEVRLECDALDPDTNGDGLSDGAAWQSGRSPTADDVDGDGLGNGRELLLGTDPFRADTDGDGVNDGADAFPLDPTRWDGSPQPGDTTPPAVTLTEPARAVLLP